MAIQYYQFETNTTDIPATSGSVTRQNGFYGTNLGVMQYFVIRQELTVASGDITAPLDSLISQCRIIISGETFIDWNSASAPASDSTLPGRFGYEVNMMGGKVYEVPAAAGATSRDIWMFIPVGAVLSGAELPRFEVTLGFYDYNLTGGGSATISSGTCTYGAVFNDAPGLNTVKCLSRTSFQHTANALESVTVKIPQMGNGWTTAAVTVQNDSEADEMGAQGLRFVGMSDWGLPTSLVRQLSGEVANAIEYFAPDLNGSTYAQTTRSSRDGSLVYPLFGVKAQSLTFIVDSSATTTRYYQPWVSRPVAQVKEQKPVQTVAVGSTPDSVLASRAEQ